MTAKKKAVSERAAIEKKKEQEKQLRCYLAHCFNKQLDYFEAFPSKTDYDAWLCCLIAISFRLYGGDLGKWPFKADIIVAVDKFTKLPRIAIHKNIETFGLRLYFHDNDGDLASVESHFNGIPLVDDTPQLKDNIDGLPFGPRKLLRPRLVCI